MKFLDTFDIADRQDLETDVCVIGAGAAGIAIARTLAERRIDTLLLETGGLEFEDAQQGMYEGKVHLGADGLPYDLVNTRLRYFGGTTNHWGGLSAPFTELDMSDRDWIPHSGWPIGRAVLDAYYEQAHALIGLGPFDYTEAGYRKRFDESQDLFNPDKVRNKLYKAFPLRFDTLKGDLENSPTIRVLLHAACTDIALTDNGRAVSHIAVKNLRGWSGQVRAKTFVLACGGLENPRLLLNANGVQKNGVGNDRDVVGRYFMEHPHLTCGRLISTNSADWINFYRVWRPDNAWHWWGLGPSDAAQARLGIANVAMTIDDLNVQPELPGDTSVAFVQELFDSASPITETGVDRKRFGTLFARTEQVPDPENRVTLLPDTDPLGLRRSKLRWGLNDLDRRSVLESTKLIAEEFGRTGLARVRFEDWLLDGRSWREVSPGFGNHHMGTTRMGSDPATSVVDANCRIHGIENVYVAGSSVFPTSSYVNPTLTLVALALRLADHIPGIR